MKHIGKHHIACRSAFSLLEMLVVTAMIAIISMSILPVYISTMNGVRIRNARNDVLATIRYAQEMAVRESREYRIYFDTRENHYRVVRLAGLEDEEKVFEPADMLGGGERKLPDYLSLDRIDARRDSRSREHYIACLPNGASTPATIRFRDLRARGARFNLEVEGALGKITLKEQR